MNVPGRGYPGQREHFRGANHNTSGTVSLPAPRSVSYFEDEDKKRLRAELVDSRAAELAKSFAAPAPVNNRHSKPLKTTQMRRFYDELKAIERKIFQGGGSQEQAENFAKNLALLKMFKAKAVYAEKREAAPREFTQFIFDHVSSIADIKDFRAFLKVFESVVAFHRFFAGD